MDEWSCFSAPRFTSTLLCTFTPRSCPKSSFTGATWGKVPCWRTICWWMLEEDRVAHLQFPCTDLCSQSRGLNLKLSGHNSASNSDRAEYLCSSDRLDHNICVRQLPNNYRCFGMLYNSGHCALIVCMIPTQTVSANTQNSQCAALHRSLHIEIINWAWHIMGGSKAY